MNYWLFQGKPERYDVATKIIPDEEETWLVTRYREQMSVGDIVFFWRSGSREERGIYGWGTITGNPHFFENWGWGIKVKYKVRLTTPLKYTPLKEQSSFSNNLIFKMPIGTNFHISQEEFNEISDLISQTNGPDASPKNL